MPPPPNNLAASNEKSRPWVQWVCLAAAGALLVALRLHAFDLPLENDECNYAYIAGRLLEGDRLYVDVWDHQPPGVFVLFAGVIALFGDAPVVFRWMTVVFSLVSLGLIHTIVRRCAGAAAAIAAAAIFALVSADPGTAGEGCNREIYMNALILAAWHFALRSVSLGSGRDVRADHASGRMIFASGCALALASSVKTIVAVHWVLLAGWIVVVAWTERRVARRAGSCATSLALFAAGPVILWLGTFAYFAATQRGGEFVDAVFLFNLSYSGAAEPFVMRFVRFFAPAGHRFIFDGALPLWAGAIGATVWLLVDSVTGRSRETVALLLLIVGGFIAVCLPARFWPHYYYLLIGPAVIAVSTAIGQLAALLRRATSIGRADRWRPASFPPRAASIMLLAAVPLGLLVTEYRNYLSQPPFGITLKRYNSRDFWGKAQGQNVRRVTDPDDEIFVFGNDAEIYYYSDRRCASRFTMITGVQTGYAGVDKRREMLLAELERRPPELILLLFDERRPWDEWRAFLDEYYGEPIGWDFHDKTGEAIMAVLARKGQPVERIDWNWDRSEVGGWFIGDRP